MALVLPLCIHRSHFENGISVSCPVCIIKMCNWMPVEVLSHRLYTHGLLTRDCRRRTRWLALAKCVTRTNDDACIKRCLVGVKCDLRMNCNLMTDFYRGFLKNQLRCCGNE